GDRPDGPHPQGRVAAMTSRRRLPDACGVAFKEWAGVCAALAEGRQSLILRKGGIAEGPGGFAPEHTAFWLYPTHVHEAEQGLRAREDEPSDDPNLTPPGHVDLRALAVVAEVGYLDQPEALGAIEEFHVWTEETVRKRFAYRQPG